MALKNEVLFLISLGSIIDPMIRAIAREFHDGVLKSYKITIEDPNILFPTYDSFIKTSLRRCLCWFVEHLHTGFRIILAPRNYIVGKINSLHEFSLILQYKTLKKWFSSVVRMTKDLLIWRANLFKLSINNVKLNKRFIDIIIKNVNSLYFLLMGTRMITEDILVIRLLKLIIATEIMHGKIVLLRIIRLVFQGGKFHYRL